MKKILAISLLFAGLLAVGVSCENKGAKATPAGADSTAVSAPAEGSIVFFQLDTLLHQYDMSHELMDAFQSKAKGVEDEITRRGNKLQADVNAFQEKISKNLLLPSVAEQEQQKLIKRKDEFDRYAARKQQELAEEQQVIMNQISDAISNVVRKYNEEKHYALILSTSSAAPLTYIQVPVVAGDPSLDITADLLKVLNEEYVKTKSAKE